MEITDLLGKVLVISLEIGALLFIIFMLESIIDAKINELKHRRDINKMYKEYMNDMDELINNCINELELDLDKIDPNVLDELLSDDEED